jgi:hypothetical protein
MLACSPGFQIASAVRVSTFGGFLFVHRVGQTPPAGFQPGRTTNENTGLNDAH